MKCTHITHILVYISVGVGWPQNKSISHILFLYLSTFRQNSLKTSYNSYKEKKTLSET